MKRCDDALADVEILQVADNVFDDIKEIPRVISKAPRPLDPHDRLAENFVGEDVAADSRRQGGERNHNLGNRWDSTEGDRAGRRNLNQVGLELPNSG